MNIHLQTRGEVRCPNDLSYFINGIFKPAHGKMDVHQTVGALWNEKDGCAAEALSLSQGVLMVELSQAPGHPNGHAMLFPGSFEATQECVDAATHLRMGDRISPIINVVADAQSSPARYIVRCESHGWRVLPEENRLPQLKIWSVRGVSITALSKEEAIAWMQQAEPDQVIDPGKVKELTEEEIQAERHIFGIDDGSGEWSQSGAEELLMRLATRQYEPNYLYNETWGTGPFDYVPPPEALAFKHKLRAGEV